MANSTDDKTPDLTPEQYVQRHLKFGWWLLLVFLILGIVQEAFHAFKTGWYMDMGEAEVRRLMLRLAHAHGVLLGMIHIVYGLCIKAIPDWGVHWRRLASPCLRGAGILLPGGFLLGAFGVRGGDPGVGVFVVPAGALLLLVGVLLTARGAGR
jgi:hypothetical protein